MMKKKKKSTLKKKHHDNTTQQQHQITDGRLHMMKNDELLLRLRPRFALMTKKIKI